MPTFTTQAIAAAVDGRLVGPGDLAITGLDTVADAGPGDLTFLGSAVYAQKWPRCKASAALVSNSIAPPPEPGDGRAFIFVDNVDITLAGLLKFVEPPAPELADGVHPSAIVDPSAELGAGVRVGPGCVVGPRVRLGEGTTLYAHVTILDESTLGAGCTLFPGVVIRERCHLGARCIVHSNASIGADGFGYRPMTTPDGQTTLLKIPQIGEVRIGDDVEIGANACIDRAKFDATVIGDGCKIDNLVQIAHNCKLGRMVIIAGCTGLAGSVVVGDGTIIGGMCAIKDHITIGKGCHIAGSSGVMDDIPDGQTWAGAPAMPIRQRGVQELAVRALPDFMKQHNFPLRRKG